MSSKHDVVPAGFVQWQGDAAEDHCGPFFYRVREGDVDTAFRVEARHCNSSKTVHGGVLMMFADYSQCIAAIAGSDEGCVTVSCNNEFIDKAEVNELVTARCEVVRKTGSLVFMRATVSVDERVILTSSAVIKRIRHNR